jgi:hypothetical protein
MNGKEFMEKEKGELFSDNVNGYIFLSSSGSGTGSTQPREPREVN